MSRDIVLKYWKIIRYKTLIIQCVPEGTPIKRFCYESYNKRFKRFRNRI